MSNKMLTNQVRTGYVGLLLLLLPIQALAQEAPAAARQHDGAAKAWVQNGRLCFGAEPAYEEGGLLANAEGVAQHRVMLNALLVHKDNQVVWQAHTPNLDAVTIRLQPNACVAYGQTPAAMEEVIPAKSLSEGLYTVMLVGSDEQKRRAWFYQHFCVAPNVKNLTVTPAQFNVKEGRWQCR